MAFSNRNVNVPLYTAFFSCRKGYYYYYYRFVGGARKWGSYFFFWEFQCLTWLHWDVLYSKSIKSPYAFQTNTLKFISKDIVPLNLVTMRRPWTTSVCMCLSVIGLLGFKTFQLATTTTTSPLHTTSLLRSSTAALLWKLDFTIAGQSWICDTLHFWAVLFCNVGEQKKMLAVFD